MGKVEPAEATKVIVLAIPVTKGDWLSVIPNPPNLDVALSTRASETSLTRTDVESEVGVYSKRVDIRYDNVGLAKEATLTAIKAQTDKLQFDANNFLKTVPQAAPNPPNLDVALSTRASEATLAAIKNALASVGTDKLRTSLVDALPAGTNTIGNVNVNSLPLKGTPYRLYTTTSGEVVAAPGAGYKLRVYGWLIMNESDEIARLRYGGSTGTIFAGCPSKGFTGMNLMGINEAGGANQNIYLEKTGSGYTLAVVWVESVAA